MTLRAFQRALCDLIASPQLCLALRSEPGEVLEGYDLSPREQRRLLDVVWQRGMSTNCTIYRSNRITPIFTLLNLTCFLLSDDLAREVEIYWQSNDCLDLQYGGEIDRFGRFLRRRLNDGVLDNPVLEEILDLELAANALNFSPRRQILRELECVRDVGDEAPLRLHPLLRVVFFRHDPVELLDQLLKRVRPPYSLSSREAYILLSVLRGPLEMTMIDTTLGRRLYELQTGSWQPSVRSEAAWLIEAHLGVRTTDTGGAGKARTSSE